MIVNGIFVIAMRGGERQKRVRHQRRVPSSFVSSPNESETLRSPKKRKWGDNVIVASESNRQEIKIRHIRVRVDVSPSRDWTTIAGEAVQPD